MGASITLAGESLIAQKQGAQQILTVSRFILANVPGLDPNGPVDRAAGKPAAGQIVGTYDVTQAGYVNPNQVVYSLMLGSDIGDFDWNWIGLETAENVLLMVAYVPTQQKRRNIPPLQLGDNVTRNFLVVFDGAQALTGLTIDASTWQHDFTVRLAGIDERERQSNRDMFGRACFFGSALQLEKVGSVYQLKPGTAYVEGVRLQRAAALAVVPPAFPTTAWLDVALQRELNDVVASWSVVWGAGKVDYVDSAGVQHYCVAIADLPNSNTITDSRQVENIAGPLVAHFAARVGDYAGLRARSTTKDDVGLGNLPNAKSDDENTDSSLILATTKAVKAASSLLWTAIANIVSGATVVGKAAKLATARTINGVPFDGSQNITVTDSTKQSSSAVLSSLASNNAWGIGHQLVATALDLNEYLTAGKFITPSAGLLNLPDGWPQGRYLLDVTGGVSYSMQIIGLGATSRAAVRFSTGSTFSPWMELRTSENFLESTAAQVLAGTDSLSWVSPRRLAGIALGIGQSWQDVTASRTWATTYTNTTGKPIQISVNTRDPVNGNLSIDLYVGGVKIANHYLGGLAQATVSAVVPPGATYRIERLDTNDTILVWAELR